MKSHFSRTIGVLAVGLSALFVATGVTGASGTFDPAVSLELSTTRATAHPDARITIDNSASDEDVKDVTINLPNGFWGSLAAAEQCDYADAQDDDCSSSSQIGTVVADAKIDESEGRLRGKVYMTEPAPANVSTDPAGITVIVRAKVGNVDLGNVIVNGRVNVRNAAFVPADNPVAGAVGAVQGVTTTFTDVPREHTDTVNDRTVTFQLQKMSVDLVSDLDGPRPPLLTNPSTCGEGAMTASFTSYDSTSVDRTDPNPETFDRCNTVKFAGSFDATPTSSASGSTVGLNAEVEFPEDSGTVKTVALRLPAYFGPNAPAYGYQADMCPVATNIAKFNPADCPAQAQLGSVTVTTPMVEDPLVGKIWLINKSPIPNIGIDISPTTGPDNPKGVIMRMVGISSVVQEDQSCPSDCKSQVISTFSNLPDAPATKIEIDVDGPTRTGTGGPLPGKPFAIATAADPACQPEDEFTLALTSHAVDGAALRSNHADTQALSGCGQRQVEIDSTPPIGGSTTNRQPSVSFADASGSPAGASTCYFNSSFVFDEDIFDWVNSAEACSASYAPSSDLPIGVNRVGVWKNGQLESRAFVVAPSTSTPDTTAPTATLSSHPTSVSVNDPNFAFTSDEASTLLCALNPGSSIDSAYLPCSAAGQTSGSFDADELFAGLTYTFAVRAEDAAGNIGDADSTTFTVGIPFAPSFDVDLSTRVARAHPELDVTIENDSHADLKDVELSMPDGFMGAITGVAELCPIAVADAGNCTIASKVGSVEAEAVVDESIVRASGNVYLTESRTPGIEPASLSIKIDPSVQEITFEPVIVNASLKVRGVAQGIDSFALDLPRVATSTVVAEGDTAFDIRRMVLKLRTGAGATYPLLTNPSDCRTMAFDAELTGYDSAGSVSRSVPFTATGCDSLAFAPALNITQVASVGGGTPKPSAANIENIDFTATLSSDASGAAIKSVDLVLPLPLTMDVGHLPFPCQVAEAEMKACPASSMIGSVSAVSPLLNTPLTGNVYVLKSPTALPRLLVALRGVIDVDLVASNTFTGPDFNMIRTNFEFIPDVPITSFTMTVRKFLRTREDACATPPSQWNILGSMGAYNGASTAVNIPLTFDCTAIKPTATKSKVSGKGKKFSLSSTVRAPLGQQLKKVTLKLPKGLSLEKKATTKRRIAKYITVKADGKKLTSKCFKRKSSTTIEITFCNKRVDKVSVSFKRGSLNAKKRFTRKKPPKLKWTIVDSSNKKWTFSQ